MFRIQTIGNVQGYAKMMKMENQWRQKQESGDYTSKSDNFAAAGKQFVDSIIPKEEEPDDRRMQEINSKINMGGSLSTKELDYLKKKSPELYEKYMQNENERKQEEKAYKEALKRCRTKEEVQRLKMSALGKSLNTVDFVKNNPNIPEDKKLEIIAKEQRKVDDVNENTQKFVDSGKYAQLPTEIEQTEADKAALEELCPDVKKEEISEESAAKDSEKSSETETNFFESEAERKVRRARAKAAYVMSVQEDKEQESVGWNVNV